MADELTTLESTVARAADGLVEDAIAAVKSHPDYEGLLSQLVGKAIQTLAASI